MADALIFLISLTLLLIGGIIAVAIAKRTSLPLPLILFLIGLILGNIFYAGRPIVQLTGSVLSAFSILALIIVMFASLSYIKFAHFDLSARDAAFFFAVTLLLNLALLGTAAKFIFGFQLFTIFLLSLIVSCVEFSAIFPRHHVPKNKITELLKDESTISCAVVVLIPFLILSFIETVSLPLNGAVFSSIMPFIVALFGGIGVGIFITLFLYKLLHIPALEKIYPLLIGTAVLVSYLVARQIQGSGLIAVAVMGLIFGNVFFREKQMLREKVNKLVSVVEMFLFMIAGIVVSIPFNFDFLRISLGLFVVYLAARFLSAQFILRRYDFYERLETALFVPKGVVTIAVAFALLNYDFFGVVLLVRLLLAFFVYSLILDFILAKTGFYKHR